MAEEEYGSEHGTVAPKLFLGMGGVGSRIVDRIAMRAKSLPNWKSQLESLTAFVSIDTNSLDQNKLKHIPPANRIQIGAFNKEEVVSGYRKAGNPQALQWLDNRYVPRGEIHPGAGQVRVESRLGFFEQSPDIRSTLEVSVKNMLAAGKNPRNPGLIFYVYLFASLAGGTGSGSFLSASYLVQDIIRSNGWQPRFIANLVLSTLMTDVVGRELRMDIHANTYAALKELEHLTKLGYKKVHEEGRIAEKFAYWHDKNSREITEVSKPPFSLSFVYDEPIEFKIFNFDEVIADASFLHYLTPNVDNFVSVLDNYEKNLGELAKLPGDLKNVGLGCAKNYGATGLAALVLPAKDLLEYCALRFAAEAVRSQITFGVDPSNPEDDRGRALADLAVDYSDHKFGRMSDDARGKVINDSFLKSVREMRRQDEREDLTEGFWYQLVESVDEGLVVGVGQKGEVLRSESKLQVVKRRLKEERQKLLNKVSIRVSQFAFHRESVNQFLELVNRLEEEIRAARVIVQQGMEGLTRSAREAEVVKELELDPITERYLVLRLFEECQGKWIPEAEKQRDNAAQLDLINNPKVKDRFRQLYDSLNQAAKLTLKDRVFRDDEPFYNVRNEAEKFYHDVAEASRKIFDAEVTLSQLRELSGYLEARARLYAKLATQMDRLVTNLLRQAEDLRKGQTGEPRLALSVEVFEMLEDPKERIWDPVYRAVFVDKGRYLSTFDRKALSDCIIKQLKPRVSQDGVVEQKIEETVGDIREALVVLGRERLKAAIFGDQANPGLDLRSGLDLEAELVLKATRPKEEKVGRADIEQYREKKFGALAGISGVLARVNTKKWQACQDGTLVNQTRFLLQGVGDNSSPFVVKLASVLAKGGRHVDIKTWYDPRIAIAYDVTAPIALYYIDPIIDDIEKAYEKVQADERRSYNLHTDYHWEESLPNLNPEKSELEASWSLRKLAEGLVAGVIDQQQDRTWVWHLSASLSAAMEKDVEVLGRRLSSTLYRLGEYHRRDDLRRELDDQIRESLGRLRADEKKQRQENRRSAIEQVLKKIALQQEHGEITQDDVLDRPILRVLVNLLAAELVFDSARASGGFRLQT